MFILFLWHLFLHSTWRIGCASNQGLDGPPRFIIGPMESPPPLPEETTISPPPSVCPDFPCDACACENTTQVCGSNGRTYKSECDLRDEACWHRMCRASWCNKPPFNKMAHTGPCLEGNYFWSNYGYRNVCTYDKISRSINTISTIRVSCHSAPGILPLQ